MLRLPDPLAVLAGALALACGSADETDLFEPRPSSGGGGSAGSAGGSASGARSSSTGGSGNMTSTGGSGGSASGGTAGATAGGSGGSAEPFCQPGTANLCSCVDGALGSSICQATGDPGPCVCEEATACRAGQEQPCPCPGGAASGVQTCQAGTFGPCTGCDTAVLPSGGCPQPYVCTTSAFGSICSDPATGLPPFCPVSGDCSAVGGSCTVTPFGAYCVALCTP